MDVQIRCICPANGDDVRHPFIYEDSVDEEGEKTTVRVGGGDTITLRDKLDFVTATAIRKGLAFIESDDDEGGRAAELLARLTEGYLLFGIIGWTVVDEKGKRLPVSHAAIRERLLSDFAAAEDVADAADSLYSETILLPLLARASKSSPPTPTRDSTSPLTAFPKKPRKPSRRSSTTSTPTDATETTSSSLVGVSSGSLNSESAA